MGGPLIIKPIYRPCITWVVIGYTVYSFKRDFPGNHNFEIHSDPMFFFRITFPLIPGRACASFGIAYEIGGIDGVQGARNQNPR